MCELLGIGRSLWEMIVDALIDEFDTPGNNSVAGSKSCRGHLLLGKKTGSISRMTIGVSLSSNSTNKAESRVMLESQRAPTSDIPPAMVTPDENRNESESSDIPATISALLKQCKGEARNTPDATIDACASFIQTQLMTKTCTNRHNGRSTKCTCIKTLDPALVRPVSSYIVLSWDSMDEEAKIRQILEWNRNKACGDVPFTLPMSHVGNSLLDTKQVCRHGLFEVLGVTRRLWDKATLAEITSDDNDGHDHDDDDDDNEANNGWICKRCDRENDAEKKRCPGCYGWKESGTMDGIRAPALKRARTSTSDFTSTGFSEDDLKKTAADAAEAAIIALSTSTRLDPGAISKPKYGSAKCIVEGCEKNRQHKCNKMCMAHFKEELQRCEGGTKRKRSSSIAATDNDIPSTMHGVLRLRKPGSVHDELAIQACAKFIRRQLMSKTCINVKSRMSTQCCCIKMLKNGQIQSAANYVATTWYKMSEKQQIQHIVECVQDANKSNEGLPFILPGIESGAVACRRNLCRNAFCEILGVSRVLWDKAMLAVKTSANETDDDDADEAFVSRRAKSIGNVSHSAKEDAPRRLLKRTAAQIAMSKIGADAQTDTEDEGGEEMNESDESAALLVPEITKGTSILKYFAEGRSYFEGKIIKVPGPGNSFYHVRYDDGDEEDLEPLEMWIAFSDWCVANDEIELTEVSRSVVCKSNLFLPRSGPSLFCTDSHRLISSSSSINIPHYLC